MSHSQNKTLFFFTINRSLDPTRLQFNFKVIDFLCCFLWFLFQFNSKAKNWNFCFLFSCCFKIAINVLINNIPMNDRWKDYWKTKNKKNWQKMKFRFHFWYAELWWTENNLLNVCYFEKLLVRWFNASMGITYRMRNV